MNSAQARDTTDIDYDPSIFGSWKVSKVGRVPIDFVFPAWLELIVNSRNVADPKIITDAFAEAEKDLRNMLARATQPRTP